MEEALVSERECRECARDDAEIELETRGRLRRIRWATAAALGELVQAPLDTAESENCENERGAGTAAVLPAAGADGDAPIHDRQHCEKERHGENELPAVAMAALFPATAWTLRPEDFSPPASATPAHRVPAAP